ncbi:MAG TPA: stage II sporulation protein M [Chloroflexia bacterium]|nr:stage II sporulation protein M [Chloroflexia bacterium]
MALHTPEELITARQAAWARLEILSGQASRGRLADLPPAEIEELGRLYRQATADLARAQRDYPNDNLTRYLNQLVGGSYGAIYRAGGWSGRRLVRFYTTDFPRLVRKQRAYVAVAAALLFLPAIAAWIAVVLQPGTAAALLPNQVYDKVQGFLERHDLWTHIPVQERPYAATAIMTNNIQVTFLAFAGGLPLGLLTIAVLVLNGVSLGAIAGLCQVYGASEDLWAFIFPHGIIELTVICLAGGAGLRLADAILRPGMLARAAQLREAAREAVQMLLGGAGLLVIAGLIEGNISPSELPAWVHFAFGSLMGVLLYTYLIFAGRRPTPEDGPTAGPGL